MEKTNTIRTFHLLFLIVSIMICGLIIINYGWPVYATITDRPGMYGHLYLYYDLSKTVFYLYNFLHALIALGCVFSRFYYLGNDNKKGLVKIYKAVAFFVAYIIIAELYVQSRYVGKG